MKPDGVVSSDLLRLDVEAETARITGWIRNTVFHTLRRKGAVIGVSGGIDSSVVAFLCARALGTDRIQLLFMPEADSSPQSLQLGRMVADALNAKSALEDISPILAGAGCYQRRDDSIRLVVPEYGLGHKCKIVLPGLLDAGRYAIFSVVVQSPDGKMSKVRLTPD
ncbi:MAG TPA: NAD(+) synthase, partial [Nitrospira sp.]|nr:NAD(+) synthase [Nitrospira sp.]